MPYKPKKPIVLVGMMGAGKSVIGRALAERLKIPFVDVDAELERQEGTSVAHIFETRGEPAFRALEKALMADLLTRAPRVIATGGGAAADEGTRRLMKDCAISIWLKASLDTLYERVKKDDRRPLLKVANPKKMLADLLEKRKAYYAQSDIQLESRHGHVDDVVQEILLALKKI